MTISALSSVKPAQIEMAAISILATAVYYVFEDALIVMESFWAGEEAYSYGYLIPVIVMYLLWQRWHEVRKHEFTGSWIGVSITLAGLLLSFLGTLSTSMLLNQYAFVISIIGLFYAILGWKAFRIIVVPLCILFFMIPLPQFLYQNLSAQLQLLSSELGVAVIRGFGISVHLQGNVIDLGSYQLQVVEACSGLNYLFPLMSFGFVCAYLFKAPFWQRAIIFLSSVPLTVFMNSFRIGVIGILVDNWGTKMAEGFLHDFEGWIVFMVCVVLMLLEVWLLTRLTNKGKTFLQVFGVEQFTPIAAQDVKGTINPLGKQLIVSTVLVFFSWGATASLNEREEISPERSAFANFPLQLNEWNGVQEKMETIYFNALKLSDYALNNYKDENGQWVNFYSAYYDSQRNGATIHSPRSCIPGGGWEIQSHAVVSLDNIFVDGKPLSVNRVEIQKGKVKQLVYYWFQQRGRVMTNEYLVKWYLFWDSLTQNRTDGALVRLVTKTQTGESLPEAEQRLINFTSEISQRLDPYIPG